jgi:hypothetical protein
MKIEFTPRLLPQKAILITCSSHEDRCMGLVSRMNEWHPSEAIIFHYDDINRKREENHCAMEASLRKASVEPITLQFMERNAACGLHNNMESLHKVLMLHKMDAIVLDISVFTKRHLLMMLQWLDDEGLMDQLCIVYSEPGDYNVSKSIPLSFGLSLLQHIPGFPACPDLSRALHMVLFLGYEGDRALAVYEHVQPIQTTLIIPHPPYQDDWIGKTEMLNSDLIAVVGESQIVKVDAIDPDKTQEALTTILGDGSKRGQHAKVICPLGTKPQTLGIYNYVRNCADPPALIYASPLRHNHDFFSSGIGKTWILKEAV